ncbi:MAG: DnaJ domain-containing protein [Bacteroidales bacterium]|jgi:DnaJ like chaperone protein|nr:DnaJ domain-containing protein [Bacteroidales bacterium]
MSKLKWIGGGLGFVLGGPIGALIGVALSSVIESAGVGNETSSKQKHVPFGQRRQEETVQGDFSVSLLVLIAAVMKADGKVVKAELDYVKVQLGRMVGEQALPQSLQLLRDLLKKDIPVQDVCTQISSHMQYSYRLELIHLLFGISKDVGEVHESEVQIIEKIAYYLDITREDITSIKAMFVKDTESAYKILEIEASATDSEVKKAYRKMAVKYHPDKVAHLGDSLQNTAKEKFQKVQQAYEDIKTKRGM